MKTINAYLNYIFFMLVPIIKYIWAPDKYIFIDGYPHTKNFGDALNIPLIEFLSGKKVLPSKSISRILFKFLRYKNYAVIGSILQWTKRDVEVWGAGFITEGDTFFYPSKVHAVRGPKTRAIYLKNKINCPPIYGDPAMLLPFMYWPKAEKKYKLGIIPHYLDNDNEWLKEMKKREDVLIIDLLVGINFKRVIKEMLSCEKILSSSLHGIILSDAYRIPNRQITLSDKVLGAEFKFSDYYLSVNRKVQTSVNPVNINIADIIYNDTISIDIARLLEVCPFAVENKKEMILDRLRKEKQFNHLKQKLPFV